jgi:SH3-like domain-containing protein
MRAQPDAGANLVATLEKEVVLELVEAKSNNGWLKVKHRDGVTGYILVSSTWGFD